MCGSRTWNDHVPVWTFLAGLRATGHKEDRWTVLHAGTEGADQYADAAARLLNMNVEEYEYPHVEEADADVVVAFMDDKVDMRPWFTVRRAHQADIPVYVIGHGLD